MNSISSVCVYCASSSRIDPEYTACAGRLGELLARNRMRCVCGAGKQGLMGALTDGVLNAGGKVTGIIPRFMCERGWMYEGLTETMITETMHERKQRMADLADAVVALPGGCGTLEELLEIITWKQLGLFSKPVVILNVKGYYDPLIRLFERAVEENFMRPVHKEMWEVADTPEKVLEELCTISLQGETVKNFTAI